MKFLSTVIKNGKIISIWIGFIWYFALILLCVIVYLYLKTFVMESIHDIKPSPNAAIYMPKTTTYEKGKITKNWEEYDIIFSKGDADKVQIEMDLVFPKELEFVYSTKHYDGNTIIMVLNNKIEFYLNDSSFYMGKNVVETFKIRPRVDIKDGEYPLHANYTIKYYKGTQQFVKSNEYVSIVEVVSPRSVIDFISVNINEVISLLCGLIVILPVIKRILFYFYKRNFGNVQQKKQIRTKILEK